MRILTPGFLDLASALTLFAQGDRGTITGTVADPAGAVDPRNNHPGRTGAGRRSHRKLVE